MCMYTYRKQTLAWLIALFVSNYIASVPLSVPTIGYERTRTASTIRHNPSSIIHVPMPVSGLSN